MNVTKRKSLTDPLASNTIKINCDKRTADTSYKSKTAKKTMLF